MADCSCDGPCADHPNCPPALTRTEPKAESIGSKPLSPVPEGLKDEMVEKAAKAPAGGWGKRELGIRDAESAVDAVADERAALTLSGTDAKLFAAGYRAGLNEAREVVEGLIEDRKAWVQDADADVESHFGETGRKLGQKAFQKNCEIAGLDEARDALAVLSKETE